MNNCPPISPARPNRFAGIARPGRDHRSAFTLVEILIVVVILAILAALVLPQFSNASNMARENTLREDLRFMRMQLLVYTAQHGDVPPGYPGGNTAAEPTPEAFVSQLTRPTDKDGAVGEASDSTHRFGPYLRSMPANPINNLKTVRIVDSGDFPEEAAGSHGWIYQPDTVTIAADAPGTDSNGVAYINY
jgi:prepilin-type N-terminal cleavage/methylation domain-containing protein